MIFNRIKKSKNDLYETPDWAVEKLLNVEKFSGSILEPCCGHGAISKVLNKYYEDIYSSDIEDYGYGNIADIFDIKRKYNNIVTNPPYNIAENIIRKSLKVANNKVAMLLKLTFLESEGRKDLFDNYPPHKIYVFRKRITMYPYGEEPPINSGTICFAWFVWDIGNKNKPVLGWI